MCVLSSGAAGKWKEVRSFDEQIGNILSEEGNWNNLQKLLMTCKWNRYQSLAINHFHGVANV